MEKNKGEQILSPLSQEMLERRTSENRLREYIRDNVIHSKELKEAGRAAKSEAWRIANEKSNNPTNMDGTIRPNDKGRDMLSLLSEQVQNQVLAHGVASNLPTQDPDFPISALIAILATGELKGDYTRVSGGLNQVAFTNAPFVLLSNKNEALVEIDGQSGVQKLMGLRLVLVNGEYEGIVEDLRKAFPWVSFRTAEQLNDAVFDKKEPRYHSYEDQIREQLDKQKT